MKIIKRFIVCLAFILCLVGCAEEQEDTIADRDYQADYDLNEAVEIHLEQDGSTAQSDGVLIEDNIITISEEATYILRGTLNDGTIVVDVKDTEKVQILLDNVSIASETSAAIYIREAKEVFVTMTPDSVNSLSNGGSFVNIDDNNIDGVIFSKRDLIVNGDGSLNIVSPVGFGIVCKDNLVVAEGSFHIVTGGGSANGKEKDSDQLGNFPGGDMGGHPRPDHGGFRPHTATMQEVEDGSEDDSDIEKTKGIKVDQKLVIQGGTFDIDSADDGIHADEEIRIEGGEFTIASGDDAIHADLFLLITGGTIEIIESYEGLEAIEIEIAGGNLSIISSDDGINAAGDTGTDGYIDISGGNIYVKASGDGIDANGSVEISGGEVTVCGPTHGDTSALDYDKEAVITGGTFVGTGAVQMAQTFSDSKQGVIALNVGEQKEGTEIVVKDQKGDVILKHTPQDAYSLVILSSPDMKKGDMYHVSVGDTEGEFEAK